METEEQRKRRLDSIRRLQKFGWQYGWQYDADIEAVLARVVKEEMAKDLKRMPAVSDKIRRLPNK